MSTTQTSTTKIIIDGGGAGGGRILGGVPVAAAAAVPAAAVKAKNRFPLTIAPLWSTRRDHGAIGLRGTYPAQASAFQASHQLAGFACAYTRLMSRDQVVVAASTYSPQGFL